jgi:hypothetical protein
MIEDFFNFATDVNDTGGAPWAANIPRIFEKIQNGPIGILRGLGETDSCEKNQKSKISVPLKYPRNLI